MKPFKFLLSSSFWGQIAGFVAISMLRQFPVLSSASGTIISIIVLIWIFPRIRRWQEHSLNNLADAVIIFEIISLPTVLLLTIIEANNIDLYGFTLLSNRSDMLIIVEFIQAFLNVTMFVPRLLSTYSGFILCWKLIRNRNQGGPYSIRARLYQGIATFAWLVQILFLAVLLFIPHLLEPIFTY